MFGMPIDDDYSSAHIVPTHLGLACVLMLRPVSLELFPGL